MIGVVGMLNEMADATDCMPPILTSPRVDGDLEDSIRIILRVHHGILLNVDTLGGTKK